MCSSKTLRQFYQGYHALIEASNSLKAILVLLNINAVEFFCAVMFAGAPISASIKTLRENVWLALQYHAKMMLNNIL